MSLGVGKLSTSSAFAENSSLPPDFVTRMPASDFLTSASSAAWPFGGDAAAAMVCCLARLAIGGSRDFIRYSMQILQRGPAGRKQPGRHYQAGLNDGPKPSSVLDVRHASSRISSLAQNDAARDVGSPDLL